MSDVVRDYYDSQVEPNGDGSNVRTAASSLLARSI